MIPGNTSKELHATIAHVLCHIDMAVMDLLSSCPETGIKPKNIKKFKF
jgi:hypothetical protein